MNEIIAGHDMRVKRKLKLEGLSITFRCGSLYLIKKPNLMVCFIILINLNLSGLVKHDSKC